MNGIPSTKFVIAAANAFDVEYVNQFIKSITGTLIKLYEFEQLRTTIIHF
jgi:hypothetical protein